MNTSAASVLSPAASAFEQHYRHLAFQRKLYSWGSIVLLLAAVYGSLVFANDANAGKFWDRLPHVFDFVSWLVPSDWNDVWRAMFDLPSPNSDGSQATDYPEGRHYLSETLYVPEYVFLIWQTVNIALFSTLIAFVIGFGMSFLAADNVTGNKTIRFVVRRTLELFRAFPEIVIAGLFATIIGLGPVPAIIAVTIHTIGALGKLYFEVIENADMRQTEGLKSVGAGWLQQLRYGMVPQVLPNFLSYALLRLEINVRASTIIGAVGGGGIGEQLRLSISNSYGAKACAIILLLFLTIVTIDQLSAYLRRKLVGDHAFLAAA
jgi:phosphonate transport system permease protein